MSQRSTRNTPQPRATSFTTNDHGLEGRNGPAAAGSGKSADSRRAGGTVTPAKAAKASRAVVPAAGKTASSDQGGAKRAATTPAPATGPAKGRPATTPAKLSKAAPTKAPTGKPATSKPATTKTPRTRPAAADATVAPQGTMSDMVPSTSAALAAPTSAGVAGAGPLEAAPASGSDLAWVTRVPPMAAGDAVGSEWPEREAMIRDAAYFLFVERGCLAGYELDDWLAAERQVDAQLRAGGGRGQ